MLGTRSVYIGGVVNRWYHWDKELSGVGFGSELGEIGSDFWCVGEATSYKIL